MTEKLYGEAHHGLYGEDALVEYWYSKILTHPSEKKEEVDCLINHLIEYYQLMLTEFPSKKDYIKKMLYMLRSIQEPFNIQTLK